MTELFKLEHYPVFEKGIFQKHPALFNRFTHYASDTMKAKFRKAWESLPAYEGSITWPLASGPGFCGGTHPGADSIFLDTMLGSNNFIYNSDCLYISPSQKVFAISDPPGITDTSRKIFTKLDRRLKKRGINALETILNGLNKETSVDDGATLCLVAFPENGHAGRRAVAFIAGDSLLFHGNLSTGGLTQVEGSPSFFATPYTSLSPLYIDLAEDDFFIIASDGIFSIRGEEREKPLEDALRERVNGEIAGFAYRAIRDSNRYLEESINNQTLSRFGGSDNISALLVYPGGLTTASSRESFILGGYIHHPRR